MRNQERRQCTHFWGKSETYQPYALIANSDNVFLANIHDWGIHNKYNSEAHYIVIEGENSNNIEVMNAQWNRSPDNTYKIVADPWNENTPNRRMHMGLYQIGEVDFEPFITEGMLLPVDEPLEKSENHWNIFPNPSLGGRFQLNASEPLGLVSVYDMTGMLIQQYSFTEQTSASINITIPGIYIVRSGIRSYKLLVN